MATNRTGGSRHGSDAYHHGNLREALLALGRRELAGRGWHGLSLRALARELSVSHSAAYRHFADREALLAALAASAMADLAAALERAGAEAEREGGGARAVVSALEGTGLAYVRFALSRPAEFRLMFSREAVPAARHPDLRAANDRASAPLVRLVHRLVAAREGGAGSGVPPEELALQLWSLVHGVASLLLERQLEAGALRSPGGSADREDAMLDVLRRGIARLCDY